jgi:putative phosphoserine phosphatase/1-acylglycerol-3-phosphate O-acyltransferase
VLKGRWGAAKLASMTGAPIVPVGMWGTERVWPRSARLPAMFNITNPPLVTVKVGKPLIVTGDDHDANTTRIMEAITALLPPAAREKRTPSEEELARTYPPGKAPTAGEHERARRPGAD